VAWLEFSGCSCLLDIGVGSGIYACAIAARYPHLEVVVFDQVLVDRIAGKLIAERGCAECVSVITGDMF
jgi:Predicted O-methyltransferase